MKIIQFPEYSRIPRTPCSVFQHNIFCFPFCVEKITNRLGHHFGHVRNTKLNLTMHYYYIMYMYIKFLCQRLLSECQLVNCSNYLFINRWQFWLVIPDWPCFIFMIYPDFPTPISLIVQYIRKIPRNKDKHL